MESARLSRMDGRINECVPNKIKPESTRNESVEKDITLGRVN